MEERQHNLIQIECRKDARDLLCYVITYDKRLNEKPGEFFNRIKHKLLHPELLKPEHFPRYPPK